MWDAPVEASPGWRAVAQAEVTGAGLARRLRIGPLGDRHIARLAHELGKLLVGHVRPVDPEGGDIDLADRRLLRPEFFRPHRQSCRRDPDHARIRRRRPVADIEAHPRWLPKANAECPQPGRRQHDDGATDRDPSRAQTCPAATRCSPPARHLASDRALGLQLLDGLGGMAELLEDHGIKVIALDLPANVSGSKAYVKCAKASDVPVVVVNQNHNGERQRFTLAHELAHLVLRFKDGFADAKQEKAADRFAGAFLMAKETLLSIFGSKRTAVSLGELIDLKLRFKVSVAAIVVRCKQLDIISGAVYSRLWAQIKALNWNGPDTREPNPIAKEVPTRMLRLCFRAVAEGAISEAKAASLLRITTRSLDRQLSAQGLAAA